jgi:hypothetical protein
MPTEAWECPSCTFNNTDDNTQECGMCASTRSRPNKRAAVVFASGAKEAPVAAQPPAPADKKPAAVRRPIAGPRSSSLMQSSCPTGPSQMAFFLPPREAISRGRALVHLTRTVWGMLIAAAAPRRERFSSRRSLLHSARSCSFWRTAYRLRTLPVAPPGGLTRMVRGMESRGVI